MIVNKRVTYTVNCPISNSEIDVKACETCPESKKIDGKLVVFYTNPKGINTIEIVCRREEA